MPRRLTSLLWDWGLILAEVVVLFLFCFFILHECSLFACCLERDVVSQGIAAARSHGSRAQFACVLLRGF